MPSFGDKLRHERESRNTPLADVARRTRIGLQYLEALERGDFDGLPGRRGFGKLYIRTYAKLFGFDPQPLISEYDRERLRTEHRTHSRIEGRPRRVRFVPPPKPTAINKKSETFIPPADEGVPEPTTPPWQAIEPVDAALDSRATESTVPVEPVAGPAASEEPAEPDPTSEAGATGPIASPATPAASTMTQSAPPRWRRMAAAVAVLVALGALGVTVTKRTPPAAGSDAPGRTALTVAADPRPGQDAGTTPELPGPAGARDSSEGPEPAPPPPASADSPPAPAPPTVEPPPSPRPVDVSEFDLGIGVANLRLVGARREFDEGEVASFWTRVRGGVSGQTIRHVWFRENRPVQSIDLQVGGANWRTFSKKTLWGTGDWAVEARDHDGKVLARVEFRCLPAGR